MEILLLLILCAYSLTLPLKTSQISFSAYSSSPQLRLSTLSVESNFNFQYSTLLSVGTPPQPFQLILDTASSYTWIPAANCTCHHSLNSFESNKSLTYEDANTPIAINYTIGNLVGCVSKDTFKIDTLTADSQYFVLAFSDNGLDSLAGDGVLGLGFQQLSDNHPTLIQSLKSQGQIKSTVFSLFLSSVQSSAMTIGEYDFGLYSDGIVYNLTIESNSGYWVTNLTNFGFEDGNSMKHEIKQAIFDVGSTLISGPSEDIRRFKRNVLKNADCYDFGYLVCECEENEYKVFPNLNFSLQGQVYTVEARNYIYYDQEYCYLLLDSNTNGYWVLGQPFFRQFYTVFDMEDKKILLAHARKLEVVSESKILALGVILGVVGILSIIGLMRKSSPFEYSAID